MKKIFACVAALFLVVMMSTTVFAESAMTRIKDIAKVQGVRSNQLMGYGLVVGLNGTGEQDARNFAVCGEYAARVRRDDQQSGLEDEERRGRHGHGDAAALRARR